MKIELNEFKATFASLQSGDVFKTATSTLFMKTEEITKVCFPLSVHSVNEAINAINLETGNLLQISQDCEVQKIDCKIVINK